MQNHNKQPESQRFRLFQLVEKPLGWKIKVSVKPFQRLGAEPALAFSRSSFSVNKIARLAFIASYHPTETNARECR